MVLMAGVLLEEGQARTYSPSSVMASLQVTQLNLQTNSSESINAGKSPPHESSREHKTKIPAAQEHVKDKNSAQKQMGLAMLFLGILAEEG